MLSLALFSFFGIKGQNTLAISSMEPESVPWKHAITSNPFPFFAGQLNAAYDFRFRRGSAVGLEVLYGIGYYGPYTTMDRIFRLELNTTSRAIRTRLRYKYYPFVEDARMGIASIYISPQIGFKRIGGNTILRGQTGLGVAQVTRTGARLDMIMGADMNFGKFMLGWYFGAGMGRQSEHRVLLDPSQSLGTYPEKGWLFDAGPRAGLNLGFCF